MSERTWMQKSGATPGKLALVGCLAVGLVFVLWNQQSTGDEKPVSRKSSPQSLSPQQVAATKKKVLVPKPVITEQAKRQTLQEWPQMPLAGVVKNDPFAKPSWYLATLATAKQGGNESALQAEQQLENLRKEPTKIVVISSGERIATIGTESYRVGDIVAGFEITEINMDGVVLTEPDR